MLDELSVFPLHVGKFPRANAYMFPRTGGGMRKEGPRWAEWMHIVRNEQEGAEIANLASNISIGPRELVVWYK